MKSRHSPMKQVVRGSETSPSAKLRGRRLLIARVVWVAVAALAMGLFVASLPAAYAHFHDVCEEGSRCSGAWRLELGEVRALEKLGLSAGFYAVYNVAIEVVHMLSFLAVGVFLFWRKSDDRMVLLVSLMLVSFGPIGFQNIALYALENSDPVWRLPVRFMVSFALVSFFVSFYLFPNGRFVPRWTRVLVVVLVVYQVLYEFFNVLPGLLYGLLVLCQLGTLVFARIYRYARVSGPVERQQSKWVVFGLTAAIAIVVGTGLVGLAFSGLRQPGVPGMLYTLGSRTVLVLALLFIPLSIGIAILKYRLWDIDVLINRTLVYGTLTATLGLLYYLGVVLLQAPLSDVINQGSQLAATASTLAVVALFMPLRRTIQKFIDKRFYRSKYDARKTLEAFGARVREEGDLKKLSEALIEVVDETMKPSHISLWLRPRPKENRPRDGRTSEI